MGKYMRKAKITGDVAVMEVVSQSSLGVRTRAKTLALQRLQSTATPPPPPNSESSYLQLRSRRLEKVVPLLNDPKKQQRDVCTQGPNPSRGAKASPRTSSRLKLLSTNSGSVGSVSISCSKNDEGIVREFSTRVSKGHENEDLIDLNVEPSYGENNLDFEGRQRSTRESTPCSSIRDSGTAGTPGSTTRRAASAANNQKIQNAIQRDIPTPHEIEEFFAFAEEQQQRLFTEKYNFDTVNDLPLPGRYEWVRVNH